jgi:hypothetical protein
MGISRIYQRPFHSLFYLFIMICIYDRSRTRMATLVMCSCVRLSLILICDRCYIPCLSYVHVLGLVVVVYAWAYIEGPYKGPYRGPLYKGVYMGALYRGVI